MNNTGIRNEKGQFLKGTHWRDVQPFRDKVWLLNHYVEREMSAGDIAAMFGVTDAAILFWLRKHGIPRRTVSQARKAKHWGSSGADNPMWNRRGEMNPRWLGGVTPERQAFYTSNEWKKACSTVWKRDNATCQRCQMHRSDTLDMPFHIHHIVSFSDRELRAEVSNLILLCESCHLFVHSNKNITRELLPKI
jgi:5-methylcytosine-specific restriction endonuclease McrA